MAIKARTLRVLPNPWTHIDHRGLPAGVVRFDYHEHNTQRGWVGARIATATKTSGAFSEVVNGKVFTTGTDVHEIEWEFATEPVTLPNTGYYRSAVLGDGLVAADKETAIACGIRAEEFEAPAVHLAKKRAEAIAEFDAHNGEGAFDALAEDRKPVVVAPAAPTPVPALAKLKPALNSDQPKGDV